MSETEYRHRTDSVEEKMQMLARAHAAGDLDIAMSLAESIKETLTLERQLRGPEVFDGARQPDGARQTEAPLDGSAQGSVSELPAAWAEWARGWRHYQVVELSEEIGLDRVAEPVDVAMHFPVGQSRDLRREVRVARLDSASGVLQEIPSQVYGETLDTARARRSCRLVFQADAPAHGRVHYLILYGNEDAELTAYTTDLTVDGEEYGLDVGNNHFSAQLSPQNGQLQRLCYRRGFGHVPFGANLELNTGGEGHGEPPGIDWGHDYMASGNYQKFRVTAWSRCPN